MTDTRTITHILTGLAQAREAFLALRRWLEIQRHVVDVKSGIDVRSYESGTYVEWFVEAELDTGNAICWWLDLRKGDNGWVVEPSVFIQHADRQDPLADLLERSITGDEDFHVLNDAVVELTSSPRQSLDLALHWTGADG